MLTRTVCLLVSSAYNNLIPDQAQQNVRPDLEPILFALLVFLKHVKEFEFILNEKKQQATTKT